VGRFAQGMLVNLPLVGRYFNKQIKAQDLADILVGHYQGASEIEIVSPASTRASPRIDAQELVDTNRCKIYISADDEAQIFNLTAVLDNLGKGASGAAVQNLDLMLGC